MEGTGGHDAKWNKPGIETHVIPHTGSKTKQNTFSSEHSVF